MSNHLKSTDSFVQAEVTATDQEGVELINARSITIKTEGVVIVLEKGNINIIRNRNISVNMEMSDE